MVSKAILNSVNTKIPGKIKNNNKKKKNQHSNTNRMTNIDLQIFFLLNLIINE